MSNQSQLNVKLQGGNVPLSSNVSTIKNEEFETVAMKKIKEKYTEKKGEEIMKEHKTNQPSEELFDHLPYIITTPCMRIVMAAIHKLEYQIRESGICKLLQNKTGGNEMNELEVDNSKSENRESEESPPEEIKSKLNTSEKEKAQAGVSKTKKKPGECLLCLYHMETMLKTKYSKPQAEAEAPPSACEEDNVVFLLYCINCDDVLLCYSALKLKLLMDVNFGFHSVEKCQPGKSHDKRYLRCMIIDKLIVPVKEELPISKPTGEQISVKVNDKLEDKNQDLLKTWELFLQLKFFLQFPSNYKNDLKDLSSNPSLRFIALDKKFKVYMQYHYLPSSQIKELGPDAKTFVYNSENIVYMIVCSNCEIKYVGRSTGSFHFRYQSFFCKATDNVRKHFESGECTLRDLRWTVLDALSVDQIYFLQKWSYCFNKCELDVKKNIWGIMNISSNLKFSIEFKQLLMEAVCKNESLKKIIEENEQKIQTFVGKDELNEHLNCSNDELDIFLGIENEEWIENTMALFIEDKEDFWIQKLDTITNGLNLRKGGRSEHSPNFYNDFFKMDLKLES